MDSEKKRNLFDEVLVEVGDKGIFQRKFNIIFNLICIIFATMSQFNIINIFAIPDHWCKVPGREKTNYTIEQWKELTIPWKTNTTTETKFSNCEMYNLTENNNNNIDVIECIHGWEYDKMYYESTIPSQENWVCNDNIKVANALMFSKVGEIIGTFLFGQIGDAYGRRPVYYLSLAVLIIGRVGMIFTGSIYPLFIFFVIFGSLSGLSVYQSTLIIAMEIGTEEDRTYITLLQSFAWTIGLCTIPIIYYFVRSWVWLVIINAIPLVPFFFLCNYLIESPRWLASKGKIKESIKELKKIAKYNKREISEDLLLSFAQEKIPKENLYGVFSLFSTYSIAKKTILTIIGWTTTIMIYIVLVLNISNLGGNPHVNFFWQGLAELPGYIAGKYMTDFLGRKLTRFISFVMIVLISLATYYFILNPFSGFIVPMLGIILKFLVSLLFYSISLHTLEIYPTCLRQTGYSVGNIVASIFGCITPYIVHLGTLFNPGYPYLFAALLAALGGFFGIFLPETLHQKLPESVAEADDFGNDQKMWFLPKRQHTHQIIKNSAI